VALLCAVVAARAELPKELRVVTFNIGHGRGTDNQYDLQRVANVIAAEKPDVVALQEVDQKTKRSKKEDQAAELAKLMGFTAVFEPTIDLDGGFYGNAVLTKLPVLSHERVQLDSYKNVSPERAEQRGVTVVELGEKGEPGLIVLSTVIDWRQDKDGTTERLASAKAVNEFITKRGNQLAILAGTMNAVPKNLSIVEYAKAWRIAGVSSDGTRFQAEGIGDDKKLRLLRSYPAATPRYALDYVMCRPANRWQVVEVRTLGNDAMLYHLPVLAVLRQTEAKNEVKSQK
jgi:endonuclease/exonuclease/phosphatase family metal-dependent hydrolase